MINKKFVLVIGILFLVFSLGFSFSAEAEAEGEAFSYEGNPSQNLAEDLIPNAEGEVELIVDNVNIERFSDYSVIELQSKDSSLKIGDNNLELLEAGAKIKIDYSGNIIGVENMVVQGSQSYRDYNAQTINIGESSLPIHPGSKFNYEIKRDEEGNVVSKIATIDLPKSIHYEKVVDVGNWKKEDGVLVINGMRDNVKFDYAAADVNKKGISIGIKCPSCEENGYRVDEDGELYFGNGVYGQNIVDTIKFDGEYFFLDEDTPILEGDDPFNPGFRGITFTPKGKTRLFFDGQYHESNMPWISLAGDNLESWGAANQFWAAGCGDYPEMMGTVRFSDNSGSASNVGAASNSGRSYYDGGAMLIDEYDKTQSFVEMGGTGSGYNHIFPSERQVPERHSGIKYTEIDFSQKGSSVSYSPVSEDTIQRLSYRSTSTKEYEADSLLPNLEFQGTSIIKTGNDMFEVSEERGIYMFLGENIPEEVKNRDPSTSLEIQYSINQPNKKYDREDIVNNNAGYSDEQIALLDEQLDKGVFSTVRYEYRAGYNSGGTLVPYFGYEDYLNSDTVEVLNILDSKMQVVNEGYENLRIIDRNVPNYRYKNYAGAFYPVYERAMIEEFGRENLEKAGFFDFKGSGGSTPPEQLSSYYLSRESMDAVAKKAGYPQWDKVLTAAGVFVLGPSEQDSGELKFIGARSADFLYAEYLEMSLKSGDFEEVSPDRGVPLAEYLLSNSEAEYSDAKEKYDTYLSQPENIKQQYRKVYSQWEEDYFRLKNERDNLNGYLNYQNNFLASNQ